MKQYEVKRYVVEYFYVDAESAELAKISEDQNGPMYVDLKKVTAKLVKK